MLWFIFISYLFLGAFIFYAIERRYEEYRRVDDNPEKLEIEGKNDLAINSLHMLATGFQKCKQGKNALFNTYASGKGSATWLGKR